MKTIRLFLLLAFMLPFFCITYSQSLEEQSSYQSDINKSIDDFLLEKLEKHRILIIPECLSHDSYDAIQLPLRIIKRWSETKNSNKLIIGIEDDDLGYNMQLIKSNRYNEAERFATICPGAWGLFSTRRINEYLLYNDIASSKAEKFAVFGFENSFHYYDKVTKEYLLPSEINDSNSELEKIPFLESEAPMIIKYAYSRFFRDYLSFKSIEFELEKNPNALFIIIVGNAHTLKSWSFNETDDQILQSDKIDTTRYAQTLGYYLNDRYNPLFIQSQIDTLSKRTILLGKGNPGIDTTNYTNFYYDFLYLIPGSADANLEEPPLISIPAYSNLSLLQNKNFQYYPNDEFKIVAQKLIYLFTGITPDIIEDYPGQVGPCSFINPSTKKSIELISYQDSLITWYKDGTFLKRIAESPADYNHRSLFKGIFRLMDKKNFNEFTPTEQEEFLMFLYAALSVIGNEQERDFSRKNLENKYGRSSDYYYYFKRFYSLNYTNSCR